MSSLTPSGDQGRDAFDDLNLNEFEQRLLRKLFSDPLRFPKVFKSWLADYVASNIPDIPVGQIVGFRQFFSRVVSVSFTAPVSTTTATEAAPLDVVSAGALDFNGDPIRIEFYSPNITLNSASCGISLWDGATDLGRIARGPAQGPCLVTHLVTPTKGQHTYKTRIWTSGGTTALAEAGPGGAGQTMPGHIAIWHDYEE